MKYIINYENNTICKCELLSEYDDKYGHTYVCLVYDEQIGEEVEVECYKVYDNESDANKALSEHIEDEMTGADYQAGYCYACGCYD